MSYALPLSLSLILIFRDRYLPGSSFPIVNHLCKQHPLKCVKDGPEHQARVTPMKYKTTDLKRSRTGEHLRCLPDNQFRFRTKGGFIGSTVYVSRLTTTADSYPGSEEAPAAHYWCQAIEHI